MRLYEVIERNPQQQRNYFTSKVNAVALFREIVTELKKIDVPPEPNTFKRNGTLSCTVNAIEIDTKLKAEDWCTLLTSDSPGGDSDLVISDFIKTRKDLFHWESKHFNKRK